MLADKLSGILDSLDTKIDELSSLIVGEPESMTQDIAYEETIYYLKSLRNQLEILLTLIVSYE